MAKETLNRENLINAVWDRRGKVSLIADAMGVSARTIYNYASKYATVQDALDGARLHFDVKLVDMAELKTQQAIVSGERWAITHVLNNSPEAKRRGWGPRQELTGAGGGAIVVNWDADND